MSDKWNYRSSDKIPERSLHIEVIADYGGQHTTDHAFAEVRNHFYRFDLNSKIRAVSEHPVYAFSTIETGFWIAQMGLHSEHRNLVIFSNTAPRGDIIWKGDNRQYFVCALLDNGIPIFAVNAGYNLSFVKDRLKGVWIVECPNEGTQFRSRDYYPEATLAILNGDKSKIGRELKVSDIPDIPEFRVASVDGYGNLKTTIKKSHLSEAVLNSVMLRVRINKKSYFVLNTLNGAQGKAGDLCMVQGSSGGKKGTYIEFIKMMGKAAEKFFIEGPKDELGKIEIEPVKA